MAVHHIDETDRKILRTLIKDARTPYLEIARDLGISGSAVHQRIAKMEKDGVITGSRLMVKPSELGLDVCVFISITLSEADKYQQVVEALKKVPEIVTCHFVTGRASLLVKAYCLNNDHLINVLVRTIQNIPYILSTETMISLASAFEREVWVMDYTSREQSE